MPYYFLREYIMPVVNLPLPETVEAVSRPIIYSILDHLRHVLHIEPSVHILFPGDLNKVAQAGATIDSASRVPNLASDRYLFIEVDAQLDPYALATTAVNQAEHPPVFVDKALKTAITPIYATTDVSLNVKYRTPSRTDALKWQDDLRVRLSQMQDIHLHRVQYHYQLPSEYWTLLLQIYTQREAIAGYDQSFSQYIQTHASNRLTLISDASGTATALAIAETQSRIQGRYGFDSIPEKPEREDNGTYVATLSYKFSYERPLSASMHYPVMVHNQLLPPEYVLLTTTNTNAYSGPQQYSRSLAALSHFEMLNVWQQHYDAQGFISVPYYDRIIRPSEVPFTGTVFYALCSIDPTDLRTLVNLTELGELQMDPDILTFIRESEYPYLNKLYKSILQLHLYRDTHLAHYDSVQCTASLDIRATYDLDLRLPHRIRFSIVTDWSVLDPDALARLRQYPQVLLKVLRSIDELFDQNPYLIELLGNRPRFNGSELLEQLRANSKALRTAEAAQGSLFTEDMLLKLLGNRSLFTDKDLLNLMRYLADKNPNTMGNGASGRNIDLLRPGHAGRTQFKSVCISYIVAIRQDIASAVTPDMIQI